MEENKKKKVSANGMVLAILFISAIIIALMWVIICNLNNEKSELEKQILSSKSESESLKKQVLVASTEIANEKNEIGEKNTISNTVSNEPNKPEFDNEVVEKTFKNYLDLLELRDAPPSSLLVKLKLIDSGKINYADDEVSEDGYVETDILYSDYKKAMLSYMTEECFKNNFESTLIKEKDGKLCYHNGGGSGIEFEFNSISKKDGDSDLVYIAKFDQINIDETREPQTMEFSVADSEGKCVISYCK